VSLAWPKSYVQGYYETEMTSDFMNSDKGAAFIKGLPAKRLGELSELEGLVLLLASCRASSFLTGIVIPIDGGHLLSSL